MRNGAIPVESVVERDLNTSGAECGTAHTMDTNWSGLGLFLGMSKLLGSYHSSRTRDEHATAV